jgi:hypothetical protein
LTTSAPNITKKQRGIFQRLNTFLDEHVLPYPVMYLTNRIIILATLALLIPLLFYTSDQAFVNALNSYLNVMSVVVSSTVLLYATIADVRDRAAAKRADEIAKAYEQELEKRILGREQELEERIQSREEIAKAYEQELEKRILGREQELEGRIQGRDEIAKAYEQELEKRILGREQELEERILGRDEIAKAYEQELEKRILGREQELEERILGREEIAKAYEQELEKRVQADHEIIQQILQNSIENILGARLEKIRIEDHKQLEEMQRAVIASNESLRMELAEKALIVSNESMRNELAELAKLVHALHQSQFGPSLTSGG